VEGHTEPSSFPICKEVIKEPTDKLPGDEAISIVGGSVKLGFTVNVQESQTKSMNLQVSQITLLYMYVMSTNTL